MARDYRSAEVFSPGTRPLPLWLWLFAALAISGFVGLIYYLDQYEKAKTGIQTQSSAPAASQSESKQATESETKGTDFSFYKLLPNISVDVPGAGTNTTATKPHADERKQPVLSNDKQSVTPAHSFVLQVGSFRDFNEADRLKARLAFLGIEVHIEKVTLNTNETWHRVRIGPLQSEREMNKIRGQLRSQQIEPIVLKVKT